MLKRGTHWMLLVGLVALVLVPGDALAQRSGGAVDIQLFRPAIDSKGYFTLNSSQVLRHLDPSFGLVVNWARRPLSLEKDPVDGTLWHANDGSVIPSQYRIDNLVTGNLQAALGLFKHFEVGLGLPITIWNGDTGPNPQAGNSPTDTGSIDAQGIGDLGLHFKGRILNTSRHPVGLGAVLSVTFPTGDKEKFLGTGRVGLHPSVVVDKEFFDGRLSLAVNVGARILAGSTQTWTDDRLPTQCQLQSATGTANCGTGTTIDSGHLLTYGLGTAVYLVPQRLSFVAEIIGQTGFAGFGDSSKLQSAAEILAGFKLYLARNSYFAVGVGRGLRGGGSNYQYGSPDVRVFGAFIFEPSIGDRDGDGIKDDVDKCPDEPEDKDGFDDADVCPDPDNDGDGICDDNPEVQKHLAQHGKLCKGADRCAGTDEDKASAFKKTKEDKDGFEDDDGCPDNDNDQDGIADAIDKCPNDAEDKDSFEDDDGCPDPDNDKDGICDDNPVIQKNLDAYKNICKGQDKCPNEPETVNGYEDEDGCPDKVLLVKVTKEKIELSQKVFFEYNKSRILPQSFQLLRDVATVLKDRPTMEVRIEGHTDSTGSARRNRVLSQERADSVRAFLVKEGVDSARMISKGYGPDQPIANNRLATGREKNRRVEFFITKQ